MSREPRAKPLTLHPFMLGLLVLLICCRELAPYVTLVETLTMIGGLSGAILLLHLGANHFFKTPVRGGIATSITVLVFGYAAELRTSVEWIFSSIFSVNFINGIYIVPPLILLWIGMLVLLLRTKTDLSKIGKFMSFLSLVVVMTTLFEVYTLAKNREISPVPARKHSPLVLPSNPPDIYYIVMDAYTSAESLEAYWGYDNSPFVNFLSDSGFHVVNDAEANYDFTPLCMATYLGMNHPRNIPTYGLYARMNYFGDLLRNAEAPGRLKESGYEIINLSIFDIAGERRLYCYPMVEPLSISRLAYTKSFFGLFSDMERIGFREVNRKLFSTLPELAEQRTKKPRFIYAHFMMPHSPFLCDQNGSHVVKGMNIKDQNKDDYLEYLIYANKQLTNSISRILKNSECPPIIILQGDHGFRHLPDEKDRKAEARTILNAYHLPGSEVDWIYDGITPVNSFRMIFNCYFGQNYGYVPDSGKITNPMP